MEMYQTLEGTTYETYKLTSNSPGWKSIISEKDLTLRQTMYERWHRSNF